MKAHSLNQHAPVVDAATDRGPNADVRFVDYYELRSRSDETLARFAAVKQRVMTVRERFAHPTSHLVVADIGCGPGAQALIWAADGHEVRGVDISAPLIEIARQRANAARLDAHFTVGSATSLPFGDESCDVVLLPEILEHVENWQSCIDEACRILRTGGVLYVCTTNRLCPMQQEFDLPLYSWYPSKIKKHCEKLAVTSHPQWVQFTSFPAINWFSFYQLRDELLTRGLTALDRFDVAEAGGSILRRGAISAVRKSRSLKLVGQLLTPYSAAYAVKQLTGTSHTLRMR